MSTEMHLIVTEAMRQAEQIQSLGDQNADHLRQRSFKGSDASESVTVTLDGRQWLTDLYIADGTLRLGVDIVAQRVNEAIQNAQAAATAAVEVQQQQFIQTLGELADSLTHTIESGQPKQV